MSRLLFVLFVLELERQYGQPSEPANASQTSTNNKLENNSNCFDMLQNSVAGLLWNDQPSGSSWGNGFDCKSSGEPLSDDPFFCTDAGWTCAAYSAKHWCVDGYVVPQWSFGTDAHTINNPGVACCNCGGGVCLRKESCWFTLGGLALQQGAPVQAEQYNSWHTLDSCKQICDQDPTCNSMAYSANAGGWCYLKDKCITQDDALNETSDQNLFHTYYKPCDWSSVAVSPTPQPSANDDDDDDANSAATQTAAPTNAPTGPACGTGYLYSHSGYWSNYGTAMGKAFSQPGSDIKRCASMCNQQSICQAFSFWQNTDCWLYGTKLGDVVQQDSSVACVSGSSGLKPAMGFPTPEPSKPNERGNVDSSTGSWVKWAWIAIDLTIFIAIVALILIAYAICCRSKEEDDDDDGDTSERGYLAVPNEDGEEDEDAEAAE